MAVSGRCPNCGGEFAELERAGVRIDACRSCRGVWLDRGELEQLVERERQVVSGVDHDEDDFIREITGQKRSQHGHGHGYDDDDRHRSSHGSHSSPKYGLDANTAMKLFSDYSSHKRKHKRKGLLDELLG